MAVANPIEHVLPTVSWVFAPHDASEHPRVAAADDTSDCFDFGAPSVPPPAG